MRRGKKGWGLNRKPRSAGNLDAGVPWPLQNSSPNAHEPMEIEGGEDGEYEASEKNGILISSTREYRQDRGSAQDDRKSLASREAWS